MLIAVTVSYFSEFFSVLAACQFLMVADMIYDGLYNDKVIRHQMPVRLSVDAHEPAMTCVFFIHLNGTVYLLTAKPQTPESDEQL